MHLVDDGEERAEAPLAAVGADGGEQQADPRVAHRRRRLRVAAGADDARRAQLAEARADEAAQLADVRASVARRASKPNTTFSSRSARG